MPSIKLNKKRVLKLVGKHMSDSELKDRIPYLGTDLEDVTKDEIIVEIFPNRPDLLSEEGFARALSSFVGEKKGFIRYYAKPSNYEVNIKKEVNSVRPYTACAVIKNLKFDENKLKNVIEIQEKLHITYGRNRKRCAIGIYPMQALKFPITYTAKKPNEIKFVPLEKTDEMTGLQILQKHKKGKEYSYLLEGKDKYPIFIDENKEILSMPPIINSEKTGKISFDTKEVFVECSGFEFHVVSKALNMLVTTFSDMGGDIYQCKLNYEKDNTTIITPDFEPEKIILNSDYIEKYLGLGLNDKQIIDCLKKMGFEAVAKNKGELIILIPSYRADILHQIDLVEDIAIGYGFENIPINENRPASTGKEIYLEKIKRKIREILIGFGLLEVCNYSLLNKDDQKAIHKSAKGIVYIENSVSSEFNSLRKEIMSSLLKTIKNNKQYEYPQNIFEIGTSFTDSKEEIIEEDKLAVLLCSEDSNFTKAKQILESLISSLDLEYKTQRTESNLYLLGRVAEIYIGETKIGEIGEINPELLEHYEIEMPSTGFEISISSINNALNIKNKNL